jgi:hypothetical protein
MAQVVEAIFERHVNWIELILTDDNYKNILQVKIQKEFKITPDYIEMGRGRARTEQDGRVSLSGTRNTRR